MGSITSPEFNAVPEVRQQLRFRDDVYVVDSTLRSLQSAVSGSRHTARDLVEIGHALDDLGVRELIVNLTWRDGLETCERLAADGLRCKLVGTGHARATTWPQWALDGLSVGVGEICVESAPGADFLRSAADLVRSRGGSVSHGFAEIYTYDEVVALARGAATLGYQSVNFHDSFFRMSIGPEAIRAFVGAILRDVPGVPPVYVHLSNFYGHAALTAVAAVAAGATAADVCLNAVGHHCGHTSLPEFVLMLEKLYGIPTGIRLERLRAVEVLIEERTGIPKPLHQPVIGEYAFTMDGTYWSLEAHLPFERRVHATYPFAPGEVGNTERVVWNDRTASREGIRARLMIAGMAHDDAAVTRALGLLGEALAQRVEYPHWIDDATYMAICEEHLGRASAASA